MRAALVPLSAEAHGRPRLDLDNRPNGHDVLAAFANHPALAHAYNIFNGYVQYDSTLTPRQMEILALRVAARRECGYLWAQHLFAGRAAGLTDEEMARVAYGPTAPFLTPVESALIRAADEVLDSGVVAGATWDALTAELDVKQLLDVIFTVGCFATIGAFMNSVEIDVDPKIPDLLAR